MKTLISTITAIAIALITNTGFAATGAIPYAVSDPTMIVKFGALPKSGNDETTTALTVEYQTRKCLNYAVCYNPYAIMLNRGDGTKTAGVGVDIKYNFFKRANDRFYFSAGVAGFDKASDTVNYHAGVGVNLYDVSLSFDAYSMDGFKNGNDTPTYLINLGVHF